MNCLLAVKMHRHREIIMAPRGAVGQIYDQLPRLDQAKVRNCPLVNCWAPAVEGATENITQSAPTASAAEVAVLRHCICYPPLAIPLSELRGSSKLTSSAYSFSISLPSRS